MDWMKFTQMVDVPSNQQMCPESILLMRTVQQDCFESYLVDVPSQGRKQMKTDSSWRKSTMDWMKFAQMVDVPRFELGASTMPR